MNARNPAGAAQRGVGVVNRASLAKARDGLTNDIEKSTAALALVRARGVDNRANLEEARKLVARIEELLGADELLERLQQQLAA